MGEIVRSVKEQQSIGLNEVHTLAIENINDVQRKFEDTKDILY